MTQVFGFDAGIHRFFNLSDSSTTEFPTCLAFHNALILNGEMSLAGLVTMSSSWQSGLVYRCVKKRYIYLDHVAG